MSISGPVLFSQQTLSLLGTRVFLHYPDRFPRNSPVLLVSNHRSFLDAMVLIAGANHPIRFACHRYMSQVPVLRDVVTRMGCFPLDAPAQRSRQFLERATELLRSRQTVGIFPEGAAPMVSHTDPGSIGDFHRGFAHLALSAGVDDLAILPVAIASHGEVVNSAFPVQWLSWFDSSEPLFQQPGWHPLVVYERVNVLVGKPLWITPSLQQSYSGKGARTVVNDLTDQCHETIYDLLKQGRAT
jgi:1-acyl-sn-glycerol-3-phosphate acyltransferase